MGCAMLVDTPLENADICSSMYMRNVSLLQRPIFLMVRLSMPLRCIAMAPPDLRMWLPKWWLWSPCWWRCSSVTAVLTAVLIADAGGMMPVLLFKKNVLITFCCITFV